MQAERTNITLLGRWWWTVDRVTWVLFIVLMIVGAIMVTAGSPMTAERLGYGSYYFLSRHLVFAALAFAVMFAISLMPPVRVRRLALLVFAVSLLITLALPFIGYENKGAVRWVRLAGFSLQPSEFLKPSLAVVVAWVFSQRIKYPEFPCYKVAFSLFAVVIALLIAQPDFGMSVVVTAVFALQVFLAGVAGYLVIGLMLLGAVGAVCAYLFLPHVTSRIDRFLDPASGDNYQVEKALEAFRNGGLLGRGPGEGEVKAFIPDSHTDFIFAVAGEEFGVLVCLLIIGLYGAVVLRGYSRLMQQQNYFVMLACAGLLGQFALQAIINMGVAVNMLPAKGMTLPFISYGGSSMLAMGMAMGMLLALTRKQYGEYRSSR